MAQTKIEKSNQIVITGGTERRGQAIKERIAADSDGGLPVWETISAQVGCPLRLSGLIITWLNVYINTAYQPCHQSSQ